MRGGPSVSRIMAISGVVTMVVAMVGFVVVTALNAFVLDEFDAYGEVAIPGSGQIRLPEGEIEISFHTLVTSPPSSGFPLPPLELGIDPPPGGSDPILTENHGAATTVNSDTHIRVWTARVPAAGVYQIRTGGDVGGYINPRLAFGRESDYDYLQWVFAALFGAGLLDVILSRVFLRRGPRPALGEYPGVDRHVTVQIPADSGMRIEQLKTIAALRDSGALTQEEFEAEKRRILGE